MTTHSLLPFLIAGYLTHVWPQSVYDTSQTHVSQVNSAQQTTQDSLQAQADSSQVKPQGKKVELKILLGSDSAVGDTAVPDEPTLLIKSKSDTVIMLMDKDVKQFIQMATGKIRKSRKQGYGGAGGTTPGIMAVNLTPVVTMIRNEEDLGDKAFPELRGGYQVFTLSGGMGYGGLGNGLRIGGGGWGGNLQFSSNVYNDSVALLRVDVGYGGLLFEKARVYENLNIMLGGVWAFGGIQIAKEFHKADRPSAFSNTFDFGSSGEKAEAHFMGVELHGGFTYTVLPWMHMGADANLLMFYSDEGFAGLGNQGFFSLCPGLRARIVFGNLG